MDRTATDEPQNSPPLGLSLHDRLGPLPPADPRRALQYDAIRYVTGYPESYLQEYAKAYAAEQVAAERKRWQRIATNAQAVTTGCEDKLDYFEVPSHLMAALAIALDEGPND